MKYLKTTLAVLCILTVAGCDSSSPTSVSSLRVEPGVVSLDPGSSAPLTVVGGDGQVVTQGVVWTSADPVLAPVSSDGRVTGGYGTGVAMITATVASDTARAEANVEAACLDQVPFSGTPSAGGGDQTFDVRFESGVDGLKVANQLAAQFGFSPSETSSDGFVSLLTPLQAAAVSCRTEVSTMTFQ